MMRTTFGEIIVLGNLTVKFEVLCEDFLKINDYLFIEELTSKS